MTRAHTRPRLALGLTLSVLLSAGCARPVPAPAPVPAPPSRPAAPAGYEGRRDSLDSVDASVLRGRRIVLDPGHGGFFPGTRGVGGLTEKEVNLAVALALRDLLVAAGAEVRLTRDRDLDFLVPADSSLRRDLAERARIGTEAAPDLFVSIHHNADPGGAHDVNETQVYYPIGEDGPGFDIAQDVQRSLARNLGIQPCRMIPGNFFVIRTSEAPALLTEGSYLTYPPTEARLRDPAGPRLEAEAIYLGIARAFMRRAPRIEAFAARDAAGRADTLFTALPRLEAHVVGAFDDVRLRVDGEPAPLIVQGDRVRWSPASPLAAGVHDARLSARLATEGAARTRRVRFTLVKPPASLALAVNGQPLAPARTTFAVVVRVLDADGLPLPDSLRVRVSSLPRGAFVPAETTVVARDGVALAYLRRAGNVSARLATRATLTARLLPAAKVPTASLALTTLAAATAVRTGFVVRDPEGVPLALADAQRPAWLDRNGFATLPAEAPAGSPLVRGFRFAGVDTTWPPRMTAIAGGALHGRRIMLDPEGGGEDAAGLGPQGTRAASLNLEVARALAGMLRAAGAEVALTRDGEGAVSELERVQSSEGFAASHYLRIGHATSTPVAGHYFSSGGGRRWGQMLSATLDSLGLDTLVVGESAKYPLAQVSAVALYASLARVDRDEVALLAPGRLRAEAYALFLALARLLAPASEAWPLDRLTVRDTAGAPVAGVPVRLGDGLVLASDAQGVVRFARTEPGDLEVAVEDASAPARIVLLDSQRGGEVRLPR